MESWELIDDIERMATLSDDADATLNAIVDLIQKWKADHPNYENE